MSTSLADPISQPQPTTDPSSVNNQQSVVEQKPLSSPSSTAPQQTTSASLADHYGFRQYILDSIKCTTNINDGSATKTADIIIQYKYNREDSQVRASEKITVKWEEKKVLVMKEIDAQIVEKYRQKYEHLFYDYCVEFKHSKFERGKLYRCITPGCACQRTSATQEPFFNEELLRYSSWHTHVRSQAHSNSRTEQLTKLTSEITSDEEKKKIHQVITENNRKIWTAMKSVAAKRKISELAQQEKDDGSSSSSVSSSDDDEQGQEELEREKPTPEQRDAVVASVDAKGRTSSTAVAEEPAVKRPRLDLKESAVQESITSKITDANVLIHLTTATGRTGSTATVSGNNTVQIHAHSQSIPESWTQCEARYKLGTLGTDYYLSIKDTPIVCFKVEELAEVIKKGYEEFLAKNPGAGALGPNRWTNPTGAEFELRIDLNSIHHLW